MKRWVKILCLFFVAIAIIASVFIFYLYYGKSETLNLAINEIELSRISDGSYVGSYSKERFSYKVEVVVKNSKITNIRILNKSKISLQDIPDKIIERVLQKQSLKVDVVTGATASSKAVLKAIENALIKY